MLVPNVQLYGGFDPSAGIEALDDARILPDINNLDQGTILSGNRYVMGILGMVIIIRCIVVAVEIAA